MNSCKWHLKNLFAASILTLMLFSSCEKDEGDTPPVPATLATVTTQSVTDITQNAAMSGGNISSDGGAAVTARGVCWSTSVQPTIDQNRTIDGSGTGSFTSNIADLLPNITYYVRSYATNSAGTAYGQQVDFATAAPASNLPNDLIAYWKMDENTGTTVADALGNWNLNFVGSPEWANGKINGALDCGTVSSRYAQKTGVNSGNTNTYTLAAWIFLEDNLPNPKLIMGMNSGLYASNAGAAEVKIMVTIENQLASLYHTSDGAPTVMQRVGGTVLSINTWYHVVAVVNNGSIDLYINGVEDNVNEVTNPINSNLNFNNGSITVGHARLWQGDYNPDRWFRGKIDEAAVWTRPLSGAEIQELYNGGSGLQYPF